jgi:hypothetical protein
VYNISNTFFESKQSGKIPIVLCRITTQRTSWIFTRRALNDDEHGRLTGADLWDGSVSTGDGGIWGGMPVSFLEHRILQFGSVQKSLTSNVKDLPSSYSQAQIGAYSITCDNNDGFFSTLLGDDQFEPILWQKLQIIQGFKGDDYKDFITLFSGRITQVQLTASKCRIITEDLDANFPEREAGEAALDVYAVMHDGSVHMAEESFTAAQLTPDFFSSDTWLFKSNFIKDNLSDAGCFFEIENKSYYGSTILQIGIDSNDYPFVTVGLNTETSPTTATYTSTTALTAEDITRPLTITVYFDNANNQVSFSVAGSTTTVAAANPYDRSITSDCYVRLGTGYDGDIQNWIWNSSHYFVNNLGDNSLVDVPDVIGTFDMTLSWGSWNAWPKI